MTIYVTSLTKSKERTGNSMFENGKPRKIDCGCILWTNARGRLHRLDGPACENTDCPKKDNPWHHEGYFINGNKFQDKESYEEEIKRLVQEVLDEIVQKLIACWAWYIVIEPHPSEQRNRLTSLDLDFALLAQRLSCIGYSSGSINKINALLHQKGVLYV